MLKFMYAFAGVTTAEIRKIPMILTKINNGWCTPNGPDAHKIFFFYSVGTKSASILLKMYGIEHFCRKFYRPLIFVGAFLPSSWNLVIYL